MQPAPVTTFDALDPRWVFELIDRAREPRAPKADATIPQVVLDLAADADRRQRHVLREWRA
jgi:hypothetical protein